MKKKVTKTKKKVIKPKTISVDLTFLDLTQLTMALNDYLLTEATYIYKSHIPQNLDPTKEIKRIKNSVEGLKNRLSIAQETLLESVVDKYSKRSK